MAELVKDGREFMDSMGLAFDESTGALKKGGAEDAVRHRKTMEKWQQLKRVGFEVITIVNCLPFEVHVDVLHRRITVRKADWTKDGKFAPTMFTHKIPVMDQEDMGDAKYNPNPILPVEVGLDFENKYKEEGGVFFFKGGDSTPPENIFEQIEQAQLRMAQWMKNKYNQACDNWNRHNKQTRFIDDRMKDAARFLYARHEIPQLPEWVSLTRDNATTKLCPACAEIVKSEANVCRFCGFLINKEFGKESKPEFAAVKTSDPLASATQSTAPDAADLGHGVGIAEPEESASEEEAILNDEKPRGRKK